MCSNKLTRNKEIAALDVVDSDSYNIYLYPA